MAQSSTGWWSSNRETDLSWWLGDDDDDQEDFGKPEENERDCMMYCIDASPQMFAALAKVKDENSRHLFDRVCKCVVNSLKRKIVKSKDDVVCVVLFNTKLPRNAMNHKGIYLVENPDCPSADMIKRIRDLPDTFPDEIGSLPADEQCDFRDLLWTLQNVYTEIDVQGSKYGSKRAFVFTARDDPYRRDENATLAKARDMLSMGIELQVIPLRPDDRPGAFQISKFYGQVCAFEADDLRSEKDLRREAVSLKDLENDLRVREVKKRSLISCPFTIGKDFHLAVKLFVTRRRATKDSALWLDARTNQPLTTETRWICADTGALLDELAIKTYHEYGPTKERVYFTKEEMRKLKEYGSPSLVLMGFKPMDRLKLYHNYKPSYFMRPDESRIRGSTTAFAAFLTAMVEMNRFAVARLIARKSAGPRFVALLPQAETHNADGEQEKPPGFHVIFLPYADDIRKIELPSAPRALDRPDLIVKAKRVIDALTHQEAPVPVNPVLQRHYDALEALALDEEPPEAEDELMPDMEGIDQAAGEALREFADALGSGFGDAFANGGDVKPPRRRQGAGQDGGPRAKARKTGVDQDASKAAASAFDWKALAENDELKSLRVSDLKIYLVANALQKTGRKADLIQRIKDHLGV